MILESGWANSRTCTVTYIGTVEGAERMTSIVAADRIARALGTTLSEMFAELERGSGMSGDV